MRSIAFSGAILIGAGVGSALAGCPLLPDKPIVLRKPAEGVLLAGFGMRVHPLLNVRKLHSGIDFHGAIGDPVRSAAPGEIVEAGYKGEHGNYVRVRHRDGLETAYAHLVRVSVKAGDCVGELERIGDIGSTGLTVGPHLHFEVILVNAPIDPLSVLGKELP